MAKAASPIRLQEHLMRAATLAAARSNRSAAEQVEYWASLGRRVAKMLNADTLLAIRSGLARLKVEKVGAAAVDPDLVFSRLENDRRSGALTAAVTCSSVRYQASRSHPGQLEKIDSEGNITVGQFSHGEFIPMAIDRE